MKKGKFLLLITLILSFVFALCLSGATVFAETEAEGEGSKATDYVVDYNDLWTGASATRTDKGMTVSVKSGDKAQYKYEFDIGAGKSLTFTATSEYSLEEVKNIFSLTFVSGTDSVVAYFDSKNNVKINKEDGEGKLLSSLENVTVELADNKIKIAGEEFDCDLNESYATVQVFAYYDTEINFSNINGIDLKTEVKTTDVEPVIIAKDGIFTRTKVIIGHQYSVSYKTYDMFSGIKENKLEYKKVGEDDSKYRTTISSSSFEFRVLGDVTLRITAVASSGKSVIYTQNFTVEKGDIITNDSIKYEINKTQYDKVQASIQDKIVDSDGQYIPIGDNFYYIDVSEYIKSDYFDSDELTYKVYYANKSASDFTSTSSKYFEITQPGKHVYFVMATDELGKGLIYDDDFKTNNEYYEAGEYLGVTIEMAGFYRVDRNDDKEVTVIHELVVPAFTFEINNNAKPKVTLGKQDTGVIGKEYKISSITVESSNTTTKTYELYFMSKSDYEWYKANNTTVSGKEFDKGSFENDIDYLNEFNALIEGKTINGKNIKLQAITNDSDEEFDSLDLTFTPKQKGAYYVKCNVLAENASSDTVVTYAIKVEKSVSSNKYESEFFKYNWKSFVYLGISIASAIGILCVLFIKPKKKTNKEDKEI